MNVHAIRAIYRFEMARTFRTLTQSIVSPVLSTSLYFVVFGSAIGSRMGEVDGIELRRVHRAGPRHAVAAEREHLERVVRDLPAEVVGHDLRASVGAGVARRGRARLRRRRRDQVDHARRSDPRSPRALFVPYEIEHPVWMVTLPGAHVDHLQPVRLHHRILGRQLREAADHPAHDRDAADLPRRRFYSIDMLPPFWQKVTLFNPVVYLISGFRWSFYGIADVDVVYSAGATLGFLVLCLRRDHVDPEDGLAPQVLSYAPRMITLYHHPFSRAAGTLWMLEEVGVDLRAEVRRHHEGRAEVARRSSRSTRWASCRSSPTATWS